MSLSNGQMATGVSNDAVFVAKLTAGTSIQFTVSGKLGGTINGMPISGSGHLEYTFNYGASSWELATDGLAQGPTLPAGDILYIPANAKGHAAVTTSGEVIECTTRFKANKDRYNFKLKGRTASVKISVLTDETPCPSFANVCAQGDPTAYCYSEYAGSCIEDCLTHVNTNCPPS